MRRLIWQFEDGEWIPFAIEQPLAWDAAGTRWSAFQEPGTTRVIVAPITPQRAAICALIVSDGNIQVLRKGIPLATGVHPLGHGDALEIGGKSFWISAETSVEFVAYDPQRHGEDVRCLITKARLSEGQEIAVCPGTPQKTCAAVYKRDAWELVQQAATPMKCPQCGFDPQAATWRPPALQQSDRLRRLKELLKVGS